MAMVVMAMAVMAMAVMAMVVMAMAVMAMVVMAMAAENRLTIRSKQRLSATLQLHSTNS
jgi:NhaP-type Na+/H+ or K+/H+ antiporter